MGVEHYALLAVVGGSATELSATDAWAEPLPVIKVNVLASLYVPWARNPMCVPAAIILGERGMFDDRAHQWAS